MREHIGIVAGSAEGAAQVALADALFVGDDRRWDVVGAQNAGLRPVLLEGGCAEVTARPSYDSESYWHHRAFNRGILMTNMQAALRLQPATAGGAQTQHQDE